MLNKPMGTNRPQISVARGKAEVKYQCHGEVPHSDERFSTVLNHSTYQTIYPGTADRAHIIYKHQLTYMHE